MKASNATTPGIVKALALTPKGATVAQVECLLLSGRGRLILTGNLIGEAKDSAQVAVSLARVRAKKFGINPAEFLQTDIHFHIPGGPTKDGPSAGLAFLAALVSAMTRKPVDSKTAFTGELSLSGKIIGVGGFSKKSLAAFDAGIARLFAPDENISEINKLLPKRHSMKMIAANQIDEVLSHLF